MPKNHEEDSTGGHRPLDPLIDPILRDAPESEGYKVLGPCVIYDTLGRGGMSVLYRGKHLNLDVDVAVKCLEPSLVARDANFVTRFHREARMAARINHPNVVRVYDASESSGVHYLVMEYIEGEDARQRVGRKGPLDVQEALQIILGASKGVAEAHRRGMVHRDIKPDNILISIHGEVKITDLGLAKAMSSDTGMTLERSRMGTPQYMPLEQWEDVKRAGPPADVWALGATFYFLLQGEDALQGDGIYQILNRLTKESFPDIRDKRPDVGEEITRIIERATRKAPTERYPTAGEMVADLEKLIHGRETDLRDPGGVRDRSALTMVSPPPGKTLAKIKLTLAGDSKIGADAESATKEPKVRRKAILAGSLFLLVVLIAVFYLYRPEEMTIEERRTGSENEKEIVTSEDSAQRTTIATPVVKPSRKEASEDSIAGVELYKTRETMRLDSLAMAEQMRKREITRQDFLERLESARKAAREDEAAFKHAMDVNTIAGYESYRKDHPSGAFIREANQKIRELKAMAAFDYELVFVEGGRFQMGDQSQTAGRESRYIHSVSVSSFYIGKYEVTQELWRATMGNNPAHYSDCNNCPVESVSWNDVQQFIKKFTAKTGKRYRLPTEAEWEYAGRGGNKSNNSIYSGSNSVDEVGWNSGNSGGRPHAVGRLSPNELGIYDMTGNVSEWCSDWYDSTYYTRSPGQNPPGPSFGIFRVLRGGHWDNDPSELNVGERWSTLPDAHFPTIGVRLVREP